MIRILFLAANPVDRDRLRLRQEFDEVLRALNAAAHGQRFDLIQEFAAAPSQLQELLFRHRPQIVHFSGHGMADGLVFEDGDGAGQVVAAATLRDLFAGFQSTVRCVVLNACYSQSQDEAIGTVIDSVVGMGDAVSDEAALAFAGSFYRALANGTTLAEAMDLGRNQIDLQELPEADKPQLLAERIDASQVRALEWDDDLQQPDVATPRGIFGLYPFNEHFFGRDKELTTLHQLLQTEPTVSICPVITGMGGLGKTQLAAHYARAHVADYPDGIFWITAADLNAIRPQLAGFCVALNLPVADPQRSGDLTEQKISAFKAYLDEHPRALLILDNVAEPDHLRTRQIGVGFTALTLGGKVLVTTRRRKLPSDRFAELPLERLLPAPARQILTTARPDLANDPDLDRLCAQFGYLPLMLNLAAAALAKRGGAIAGYLQKLAEWGIDTLHDRAKVSLDDYHTSLTAVLQEQWAMLTSEDACLLLRVAGQLPEAEVIPTARLGLLAGLRDVDEWECPLRDGLEELESASLIEMVDEEAVRLHPLIRDFARALVSDAERAAFCTACAQRLANAYGNGTDGLKGLGLEYEQRGISALLIDLITAIDLAQPFSVAQGKPPIPNLQTLLRKLRLEAHHLQTLSALRQADQLWQQLLPRTGVLAGNESTEQLAQLLRQTLYWLPHWGHQRQSPAIEQTLTGHKGAVNAVVKLSDGRIVSASSDGTLRVWNLASGEAEQTLSGYEDWVLAVAELSDRRIVSTSSDRTLKVWNLETSQIEQTLVGHEDWVLAVSEVSDGRIVSASSDRTLKMWNLASGEVEQTLSGHESDVTAVVVLDAERIVSASSDNTLIVWNLVTGTIKQTLRKHKHRVNDVAMLYSERVRNGQIAVETRIEETRIFSLADNKSVSPRSVSLDVHFYSVDSIDAQHIVSASHDHTLKVWNLQTGEVVQTLVGHEDSVRSVEALNTQYIISGAGGGKSDRTLKIWDLQTGGIVQTLFGHEDSVFSITALEQGIVSASLDHTIKVWNFQIGVVAPPPIGHEASVFSIVVLDIQHIVSASRDHTLKIWNLQTGEVVRTLVGHKDWVRSVALLNSQRIVSASSDHTLKVWNLQTGEVEQTLVGHEDWVRSVAVLDDQRIVSASSDHTLKVWNLQTGEVEQTLVGHEDWVRSVAVLDDQRIVSASSDRTLKVWNLQTGEVEQTLVGHEDWVRSVTVLDSQRIVSTSSDRTLKIWNLQTGKVEQTLVSHEASVNTAVVLDRNRIISASSDRSLKVWNLQIMQVVASITLDGAPYCLVVTRQDGRTLVVTGDAGGALYCLELVEPVGG